MSSLWRKIPQTGLIPILLDVYKIRIKLGIRNPTWPARGCSELGMKVCGQIFTKMLSSASGYDEIRHPLPVLLVYPNRIRKCFSNNWFPFHIFWGSSHPETAHCPLCWSVDRATGWWHSSNNISSVHHSLWHQRPHQSHLPLNYSGGPDRRWSSLSDGGGAVWWWW